MRRDSASIRVRIDCRPICRPRRAGRTLGPAAEPKHDGLDTAGCPGGRASAGRGVLGAILGRTADRPLDQAARAQLERLPVITLEPGAEITPLLAEPTQQIGPHPTVGRPHTPPGPAYGVGTGWVFLRRRWAEKAAGSRLSQ